MAPKTYVPISGQIKLSQDINGIFNYGNDIASYHGKTWYYYANADTGTFSGTTLNMGNFRGKQLTDPATSGSQTFSTAGTFNFIVPLFRNSFKIEIWGGGGGGGASEYNRATYATDGSSSTCWGITAGYGRYGTYGQRTGAQSGGGGTGGTVSGTPQTTPTAITTTNGNNGTGGNAGGNTGGTGAAAPNGGASAAGGGGPSAGGSPGSPGNSPGGGGGGGSYNDHSPDAAQAAGGGGGSGAYANLYFTSGSMTVGQGIAFNVGAGGIGGGDNLSMEKGGNGASGQVKFTWT